MSATGKRAIEERVRTIAEWRREREMQDMLGLGPEAAQRSRRSATGLLELADAIAALPDDDPRITELERLAFSGDTFVPGATLLEELGVWADEWEAPATSPVIYLSDIGFLDRELDLLADLSFKNIVGAVNVSSGVDDGKRHSVPLSPTVNPVAGYPAHFFYDGVGGFRQPVKQG